MSALRRMILVTWATALSAQILHHPAGGVPPRPSAASGGFNLDFEDSFSGAPAPWAFVNGSNNEYQEALDPTVFYSGRQSLRISSVSAPSTDKGYAYQELPSTLLTGKKLHLSGAIRTSQNSNGFATIFVEVDEPTTSTVFNLQPNAPTGTTDWRVYTITATLPADATDVLFGVTLHGSGTAWFDHLSIDEDGVPLALAVGDPTPAEIQWLQQNATPFTSSSPR